MMGSAWGRVGGEGQKQSFSLSSTDMLNQKFSLDLKALVTIAVARMIV